MNDRAGMPLLGFALFGWAWPVVVLAGKLLLAIYTVVYVGVLLALNAVEWARLRLR